MDYIKTISAEWRLTLWLALGLGVLTLGAYWQVTGHGYVNYDDQVYILENPHIRDGFTWEAWGWLWTTVRGGNWHPLVWVSILVDVELYGVEGAGGHHLSNVILHLASTWLLLVALVRMTRQPWPSALVAALFALHPLHVESVAWAAERKDTLSGFFWMLTLLLYVWYARQPRPGRYALVTAAFICGLLSKSLLVTLPCALLLLDVWPLRRLALPGQAEWSGAARYWRRYRGIVLEKLPWLGLSLGLAVVTVLAQRDVGAMADRSAIGLGVRLANALVAYVAYLAKTFWPAGLQVFYPHPLDTLPVWQVAGAVVVLAAITWLAWHWRERFPYLGVGWLWYLGTLVPMIGIVQVGEQAMADRYTYIPLIGIFMAGAWGLRQVVDRQKQVAVIVAALLVLVCTVRTWQQVQHWESTETLFRHALTVNPDNYLAHGNLAAALAKRDEYQAAIGHFEEVLRIKPGNAGALSGLGAALYKLGQEDEAIALYQQVLQRRPNHAETHVNYGTALLNRGQFADALVHYEAALPAEADNPIVHYGLAESKKELGRAGEAMVHIRRALALDPDYAEAYNTLGILLRRQNQLAEAETAYRRAIELNPEQGEVYHNLALLAEQHGDSQQASTYYEAALARGYENERLHFNLGNILQRQQQLVPAVEQYQAALRLNQAYQPAWVNLGVALTALQKFPEAFGCFEQAIELRPDDPGAHNGYGAALFYVGRYAEAVEHFQATVRLNPTYPGARENLARAEAELHNQQNAP